MLSTSCTTRSHVFRGCSDPIPCRNPTRADRVRSAIKSLHGSRPDWRPGSTRRWRKSTRTCRFRNTVWTRGTRCGLPGSSSTGSVANCRRRWYGTTRRSRNWRAIWSDSSVETPIRPPWIDVVDPIAIIGLGCRFPGAHGPQEFWDLLVKGTDAIRPIPGDRWDSEAFYDPDPRRPGKTNMRWGGFLDG